MSVRRAPFSSTDADRAQRGKLRERNSYASNAKQSSRGGAALHIVPHHGLPLLVESPYCGKLRN
jgi:hypothetical protein